MTEKQNSSAVRDYAAASLGEEYCEASTRMPVSLRWVQPLVYLGHKVLRSDPQLLGDREDLVQCRVTLSALKHGDVDGMQPTGIRQRFLGHICFFSVFPDNLAERLRCECVGALHARIVTGRTDVLHKL